MRKILIMLSLVHLLDSQAVINSAMAAETKNSISAIEMKPNAGEVKFTAIGKPGFLKIKGESKGICPTGFLNLEKNKVSGEFLFALKNLDTGIDLRNEHMLNKYLEVGKYPDAVLKLDEISVSSGELTDSSGKFTGKLSLHGVTRDVSGNFNFNSKNKLAKADFEIKVSDFKIDIPKYLGVTVSETVQIEIEMTFK